MQSQNSDSEWYIPPSDVPIRQGDVLINREMRTSKVREICLVITADCDISKGKFGKQLACLRVLALEDYVKTHWATSKLEKLTKVEGDKLRAQIAKWHTKLIGTPSQITTRACVEWVCRQSPSEIAEQLVVPIEEQNRFTSAVKTVRAAFEEYQRHADSLPINRLARVRSALKAQDLESCKADLLLQAKGEEFPEDVFLLSSLPQLEIRGALILLREIVAIPFESVYTLSADASEPDSFLRIGRLTSTFKYATSQAFAGLYSKIGLPSEYEQRCKEVVDHISGLSWEMA